MSGTTTSSIRTAKKGSDVTDLAIHHNLLHTDLAYRGISISTPVIKSGGSAVAKTGAAATLVRVGGVLVSIAASTDLTVLTGLNITAGSFNVVIWSVDAAGTVTANFGTEGTTLATVVLPNINSATTAFSGATITYASAFTGNTTPLDTATTVYFPIVGPWTGSFQSAKIGDRTGTAITSTNA